MPSTGIASASRIRRTIVSSPFGVLKNRIVTRKVPGRVAIERGRYEQPVNAVAFEQRDAVRGTKYEGGGRERIREQGRGRQHGHAGERGGISAVSRIDDVAGVAVAAPLV